MEKENITLDPRSSFTPSSSADIPVPPDGLVQRSTRIKRIQTTAMLLLFFAAVINYLDRSSLSVANLTIREELGLSATEIGALLSVFSLAYGIAQLPCGPLLDRKGPRLMLGLGMFFWSLFQAMSGMVHSFTQFVLVRIGMGIGEAPMNPCGVKVINDWFNIKERGRPMGFFNAASTIGVAVSPPKKVSGLNATMKMHCHWVVPPSIYAACFIFRKPVQCCPLPPCLLTIMHHSG